MVACTGRGDATPADSGRDGASRLPAAHRVIRVDGFRAPESARYDAEQDVWFVSNVNGGPSAKDYNGYIVRLEGANPGRASLFAQSGKNGVVLHAPKGMLVRGDTLWIVDLDQVVGLDKRSGSPLLTVNLASHGPHFLNDIAVGGDGAIYVTDTGIIINEKGTLHPGPDRLFRIGPGHAVGVVAEGDYLARPNGLGWDAASARWIIASFAPIGAHVYALRPGEQTTTPVTTGPGKFDGLVLLGSDRMLVSSWVDSTVYLVERGRAHRLITKLPEPAALGYDAKRQRLAIPLLTTDRVEIWQLKE